MKISRLLGLTLLTCSLLTSLNSSVQADAVNDAVSIEMTKLAKDLEEFLKKKQAKVIYIAEFKAPAKVQGGASPELQTKLGEALQKLGFTIDQAAYEIEIRGEYFPEFDEDGFFAARVVIHLYDDFSRPLVQAEQQLKFHRDVYGEESVARILGISYASSPTADYQSRSQDMKKAFKGGEFHLEGTKVFLKPNSPFAVEVLVKKGKDYFPVTPTLQTALKFPFAPIPKKSVYGIRLINNSPNDAAVNLTIDGLSTFRFSELDPQPGFWLVPAGKTVFVRGWHRTLETLTEFKVVDFPETATSKLKLKPHKNFGMVQASFSACWEGDNKPKDEGDSRGTGFGDDIRVPTQKVKRHVGHVRATIAVRYERHDEL